MPSPCFGKNSASYKFALAKSLLEMSDRKSDFITLEELAEPFSRHTAEHLKSGRKQITRQSSPFIDACKKFNNNESNIPMIRNCENKSVI